MKKASYLVDFLKSFELILEIEELMDEQNQTLLDRIIPLPTSRPSVTIPIA